jgi:hypothetical protein
MVQADKNTPRGLEGIRVNVKLKIPALWASLMFLYMGAMAKS